jgi:hypothetical protein
MGDKGPGCRRPQIAAAVAALIAACVCAAPAAGQRPQPVLADVLRGAAAYALRVEEELAVMVADEQYEQWVRRGSYIQTRDARPIAHRDIVSEVLFMWVPEDRTWLTARNVHSVDGRAVTDSERRLDQLISSTRAEAVQKARLLRDEGARFNIGVIQRNFADPTLAQQFLHPAIQPRFTFRLQGRDRVNGFTTWKLAFAEQARPTLIRSNERDAPATGELWVRVDDFAVVRTRFRLADSEAPLEASIEVNYQADGKFSVLVPRRMDETYQERRPLRSPLGVVTGFVFDRVDCVARYANFRRFDTAVRVSG